MSQDSRPFKNSNLFSNYYLEKLVRESSEWREAQPEGAFAAINDLYQRKARVLENYNESQLEENFIRPVLRILGHHFGVQGKVAGKDRTPDYAFFPDEESLDEAEARPKDDYYRRAVAVGDAKSWKVQLDKSRKGQGSFEMQNPSFQIDVYLRDTPPKWAILTSGRFWRLYHEATSYKLDYYYEVDLPALLGSGDIENFKYFYLFFRREALPSAVDGDSFLDRVREGSVAYAQEIGEDLQENVYRAMKILAEGFFAEAKNGLSLSEATVRQVQENSLRLLYRLLFIFYAESRGLLDANNRYYYELSLQKLKTEVAARLDRSEPLLSIRYSYGDGLKDLFRLINDGSESRQIPRAEFYIPAYNGGLFDPVKNAFLEEARIGDSFLAKAIDLLARSGEGDKKGFVDYSSLEIRHLGSIYEGLLEYRLCVAETEMAAVKEKGKELWLPVADAGKRKILDRAQAGEIYLSTDKGERKATGSYYTPDYIVKYIVKNTIEPVVERKKQEWLGTGRSFADYVLSIKVLDPAMGSGHFLVEATDQLARWLVHAWATARPEDDNSKEIAEQDIHWARREVVRNCIYGVDLNQMAVELAKLSLWLTTVASNKPLSFLDHHLRCGNSLIGADLSKLTVLPAGVAEQTPLWSFGLKSHTDGLLKKYSLMAALPDDNLQMVKWKEDQFRQIKESELSRRLVELANVWLSTYFGNNVTDDDYYELQNHLNPEKFPDWGGLRGQEWFTRAEKVAGEKRFFHWELEFPEAFQGEKPGFDVVIGNPPWGADLSNEDKSFCRIYETDTSTPNSYIYFIKQSELLTRLCGYIGLVIPDSILIKDYPMTRKRLLHENSILKIIYLEEAFKEVNHDSVIIIFTNIAENPPNSMDGCIPKGEARIDDFLMKCDLRDFDNESLEYRFNLNLTGERKELFIRLNQMDKVKKIGEFHEGIHTGNIRNKLFYRGKPQFSDPLKVKPCLIGDRYGDIFNRYFYYSNGNYVIYDPAIIDRDNGEYASLRDENIFLGPKLYVTRTGNDFFSFYDDIFYASNNLFSFKFKPKCDGSRTYYLFILSLLNSRFAQKYNRLFIAPRFGKLFTETKIIHLEMLPIRRISFTTPAPERPRLGAELQQLYADGKFAELLAQVDACLPKDEAGSFIAEKEKSDVVHDLLAHLAEQMLEMNKRKQQEIRGFLGWLEGYVGAKVDDLTPKTKLQGYYEHDYEGFLAVLKKNRNKLTIDPARREPAEALKAEFEGSVGKLAPLRERIERTDGLIDAIVYRLYGLTDEEIAIVEGRETTR